MFKLLFGPAVTDTSPAGVVNATDWKKIGIHAVMVALAAGVTVIAERLAQVDFGQFSAFIVPIVSSGIVLVQKWIKENDVQP